MGVRPRSVRPGQPGPGASSGPVTEPVEVVRSDDATDVPGTRSAVPAEETVDDDVGALRRRGRWLQPRLPPVPTVDLDPHRVHPRRPRRDGGRRRGGRRRGSGRRRPALRHAPGGAGTSQRAATGPRQGQAAGRVDRPGGRAPGRRASGGVGRRRTRRRTPEGRAGRTGRRRPCRRAGAGARPRSRPHPKRPTTATTVTNPIAAPPALPGRGPPTVHRDRAANYTPEVTGGRPPEPGSVPAPGPPTRRPEAAPDSGSAPGVAVAVVALPAFKIGTVTSLILSLLVVTFAAGEAFAVLRRAGWRPATLLGSGRAPSR